MPNFDFAGFFNAFDAIASVWAASDWIARTGQWIETKYTEAPALVLGLGIALVLPVIATAGVLVRLTLGADHRRRDTGETVPRTQPLSTWRQNAHLEMADRTSYQIIQGIVRIGREADNDLCLSHPTVHRYHAVLERSPEAEFVISYIGDPDHPGLLVNGEAVQRQRLRGGEALQLGAIELRFSVSPA